MTYRDSHFTQIKNAAEKSLKHRIWKWSRRDNGFSDMPLWRVVARKVALPLTTVLAFVNRLEELANKADQRGSVADFNAAEFGMALDIADEDAARIYAALEDANIGWIAYDHIANFHDRNRDGDGQDDTAAERNRRLRARKKNMQMIVRMAASGQISALARPLIEAQVLLDVPLSTALERYAVTLRHDVTVTAEQSRDFQSAAVDNNGASDRGATSGNQGVEAAGSGDSQQAEALQWLTSTGKRMLVDHLQINPTLAETYLERWRRDLQDDAALRQIILGADKAGYIGARFHNLITEGVKRRIHAVKTGEQTLLPLPPAVVSSAKKGAA